MNDIQPSPNASRNLKNFSGDEVASPAHRLIEAERHGSKGKSSFVKIHFMDIIPAFLKSG